MDNLLSIVTFLPLVGAVVVFALKGDRARWMSVVFSMATFLASIPLWWRYDPTASGSIPGWPTFQLVEGPYDWLPDMGIHYHVGIDGIALLLVLLTTLLTPIVLVSSWRSIDKDVHLFMGFMLLLETGMIGSFVALDTFLFYVFWELMLVPMYFIIGIWGGTRRIYATIKFVLFTLVGSLLMLVAILVLYVAYHQQTGAWSAGIFDLYSLDLTWRLQLWMFAAFALAFAIKVPMFPFHTWLPDAHVQAPTGGSVILAGVLLKMGTFGFIRYAMPLFPQAVEAFAPALIVLSVVGVIYGALVAMVQDDIKKLVAYSSVSHMGVVMLGLFALNTEAFTGAVYQMLNHGLSTGALFLLVGIVYERRHTRAIGEYGGLAKVVPLFSVAFLIATFSSIGLPGLNGFIGELLILLGSFEHHPVATAFATTGVVLGAVYMLWLVQRVFFGPLSNPANRDLKDLNGREIAYLLPIGVLMFAMGLYPQPLLERLEPSVEAVLRVVESGNDVLAEGPGGHR